MDLRFLATGDIQAHNWRQFAVTRKNGMNSRLYNILKVFRILRAESLERGIRRNLLNGDIFEETDYIPVEVYDAVYRELEETHDAGIETVINLGNHDMSLASTARLLHSLRPFRKVARIVETPEIVWDRVFVFPYEPDSDAFKSRLQKARPRSPSVLVLHSAVQGGHVGPRDYLLRCPVKLADLYPKRWRLVLLSDFHTSQFLRKNVLYMGSPLQHTFGENHRPCLWDISLADKVRLRKIYTNLPMFKRVTLDEEKLTELKRDISKGHCSLSGHYVRFTVGPDVDDGDVEELAEAGKFQCQIHHEGEEEGTDEPALKTMTAVEVISRYVTSKVDSERRKSRLISLGTNLYGG